MPLDLLSMGSSTLCLNEDRDRESRGEMHLGDFLRENMGLAAELFRP